MDEERGRYLAGLAMTSEEIVHCELPMRVLWLIVAALLTINQLVQGSSPCGVMN